MTSPPFLILGRSEAAMLLRDPARAAGVSAILQIRGRYDPELDLPANISATVLHFDDLDPVDLSDPMGTMRSLAQQRWGRETGRQLTPPTREHARQIIDFAMQTAAASGAVLFVCQGGVSRSAGAAVIALSTWLGEGAEAECVRQVAAARQGARPLRGLIALADKELARGGKLIQAITTAAPENF